MRRHRILRILGHVSLDAGLFIGFLLTYVNSMAQILDSGCFHRILVLCLVVRVLSYMPLPGMLLFLLFLPLCIVLKGVIGDEC